MNKMTSPGWAFWQVGTRRTACSSSCSEPATRRGPAARRRSRCSHSYSAAIRYGTGVCDKK